MMAATTTTSSLPSETGVRSSINSNTKLSSGGCDIRARSDLVFPRRSALTGLKSKFNHRNQLQLRHAVNLRRLQHDVEFEGSGLRTRRSGPFQHVNNLFDERLGEASFPHQHRCISCLSNSSRSRSNINCSPRTFLDKSAFHLSKQSLNNVPNDIKCPKLKEWYERKLGGGVYAVSTQRSVELAEKNVENLQKTVKVGVLGASGYTGSEIVRLLANHPYFGISLMTADRKAGQSIGSVFPHLIAQTQELPDMVAVKDANFDDVDAVFCCLPHGTTQEIIKNLPERLKIVDLSADFRLRDTATYEEWYGQPHQAHDLQKKAVYGLTEIWREEIRDARLVANPGCYPTSVQLPLIPLIKTNLIKLENIIIDAKSGVSGAGRGAKEANLYTEIAEGIHAYGITGHRHVPEIEQGLADFANGKVTVSFTPHLMPMSRGMLSTIYVEMAPGIKVEDLRQELLITYKDEKCVFVLEKEVAPHTRNVRGSNYCFMNVFPDRIPGRAIIISVIDNLVKGASGQALQNLNLMMGFPETMGLGQQPLFP